MGTSMIPNNDTLGKLDGKFGSIKSQVASAENHLEHAVHEVGQKIGETAADWSQSTKRFARSTQDYMNENPGKSVAIATAAGVLIGSLATVLLRRQKT